MNPRTIATGFLVALVLVMVAVTALSIISLTRNRSDLASVAQSVRISDAYWAALNSAQEANLQTSRLGSGNDAEAREKLTAALLDAFQATQTIKEIGAREDKELILSLERRFATPMAQALQFLARPGTSPPPESAADAADIMAEVQDALSQPAASRREQALEELSSLRSETQTRSAGIMSALAIGFLAIGAGVIGFRHYERRAVQQEAELRNLREAALVDSVSQLGNHRAFQEELQRQWLRSERQAAPLTLALFDLDDFKQTNDRYGHAQGDSVLAEFAQLLRMILPDARAFRVGGDEFALLISERESKAIIADLGRVLSLTKAALDGVSVSIGLCSNARAEDPSMLRQMADVALYAAKDRGKDQIAIYEESMDRERREAAGKATELERILGTRDLRVVFQPIYNLRDGQILACEALARLPGSPIDGPEAAFEVADKIGSSWALDRLCLEVALTEAESLPADIKLFLNLDPKSLRDPDFSAAAITEMVRMHGLRPDKIVVELTEQNTVASETLRLQLSALRAEGFGLALDDVGAGNSGLELLRSHRFDYVKVDASVVNAASREGTNGKAVLMAILAFAAESDAHVIAEGVETAEVAAMLTQLGSGPSLAVEALQGFLFSHPVNSMVALKALVDDARAA